MIDVDVLSRTYLFVCNGERMSGLNGMKTMNPVYRVYRTSIVASVSYLHKPDS